MPPIATASSAPPSPELEACWNQHDRAVIEHAERLAQEEGRLLDALMASHRAHPAPPGTPRPDPRWQAYLKRRDAVLDNVFDALEEMLALLPVPHAVRADWTPAQVRRHREEQVLDTMNLSDVTAAFGQRARRLQADPTSLRYSWFGFGRADMVRRFGKPHSGFRNHDGLFGMWWFQVPAHPWIGPHQVFNVCAGPTGLRAGLLTRNHDPATRALWSERDRIHLTTLLIVWFHSSIAAALDPARPTPWDRLHPWTFEAVPAPSPRMDEPGPAC